jgi:hypothetical protein
MFCTELRKILTMSATEVIYVLNLDKGITRASPQLETGWDKLMHQIGRGVYKKWTSPTAQGKGLTYWTAAQTLPLINARIKNRGNTIDAHTLSLNSTSLYIFVGRVMDQGREFAFDAKMFRKCSEFWDADDNLEKLRNKKEVKLPGAGVMDEHRLAYLILSAVMKLDKLQDGGSYYTFAGVVDMGYLEATSSEPGATWPAWLLKGHLGETVRPVSRELSILGGDKKKERIHYLYPWIGGAWKKHDKKTQAGHYNLPDEPWSSDLFISSVGVASKVSATKDEDEALGVLKRVAMHNLYALVQMSKAPLTNEARAIVESADSKLADNPVIQAAFGGCACKLAKQMGLPSVGMGGKADYGGCAKCQSVPLPWK